MRRSNMFQPYWATSMRNASRQASISSSLKVESATNRTLPSRPTSSSAPLVTAHGEGRALFRNEGDLGRALVSMRYVNNKGEPTETYPYNPSGSPQGITGLTTADGRFTIFMPHPERVFRNVQMSWAPPGSGEDSPWMQLFYNARRWVG